MSEQPLSRDDQLKLKAYDSLNYWNDNESKVNLAIDALPISVIGAIAYTVLKLELDTLETIFTVVIPSLVILCLWLALCWKYSHRVKERFKLMREIECDLGFSAHKDMDKFIQKSCVQRHLSHFAVRVAISVIFLATAMIACLMYIL